jgi:hypothetical protein
MQHDLQPHGPGEAVVLAALVERLARDFADRHA